MGDSEPLVSGQISSFSKKRDLSAVIRIEHARFDEPLTKVMLDFIINRYGNRYCYVVDVNGDGVADAYILSGKEEENTLHIYSIATRLNIEGKGWGRKLLQHLIKEAQGDRCSRIILEVREDNNRAQTLYHDLGWSIVGNEKNYYNDGTTAIRMELLL